MPRSPSRDLSDRFDGNRRYFARTDRLRRDRYALAVVALVVAGCWAVADVAGPQRAAYMHSHGPLANPHAVWEDDCAACHRGHSLFELGPRSVFRAGERWHDLTCERCHRGPAHGANVGTDGQAFHDRCSNCHHDHDGRDNSLVRIDDAHCTRCHADLAPHAAGTLARERKITGFATDHPEFRPLKEPPHRALKFSHAVHLSPGQAYTPGGKEAMTLRRLRERGGGAAVERLRKPEQGDDSLVMLDCASCHQLDSGRGTREFAALAAALDVRGEPARAVLPQRAAGANFLPVNFELHCRACHPLRAGEGVVGGKVVGGFEATHRKQSDALKADLEAGYLRKMLAADRPALAVPAEPGGPLDFRPLVAARTIREEVERMATGALGTLGCAKCHDSDGTKVAPVPDRTVWFTAARFDHVSHRAASCATCHPNARGGYTPPEEKLIEKEPVQILGIDSCRACHSPVGTRVTSGDGTSFRGGGVRSGCADCHSYHNADHGGQGRGAAARFPDRPLTLAEFFSGK